MALEDFEKQLAQEQAERSQRKRSRSKSPDRKHRHKHHHRSSRHHNDEDRDRHRSHRHRKRRRREDNDGEREEDGHVKPDATRDGDEEGSEDEWIEKETAIPPPGDEVLDKQIEDAAGETSKRDSWMEAPSSMDIDYVQRKKKKSSPPQFVGATDKDYKLVTHKRELNHELQEDKAEEEEEEGSSAVADVPAQHHVSYKFGDEGSHWRMSKLKGVYREAEESHRPVEEVAVERFGDLRAFDDAREEEIELDRRHMYGKGYVGKEKPSGELFQDRKLDAGIRENDASADVDGSEDEFEAALGKNMTERSAPSTTVPLDQTALNKLKAQMMKAKLRGAPEAAQLESEYNAAMSAGPSKRNPEVITLNKMENRMLAGSRKGEIKSIDNKRGRERRQVEENEDMSIEDMVRQERRSKGQSGGDGRGFAERIAKDAKFDNDLDYMDENAAKLARVGAKSDINLRNTAISEYQKTKRILDTCPLCHHEDTSTPPQAPLLSLATRVYLTLPTSPEITPYGLCATIVPIQHRNNLLECDDDEWEEIRNFMKALTRFYFALKPSRMVVFYENAAHQGRKRHASLEAIPLPRALGETAPAFFREAILAADEEWTQHKKLIDTAQKASSEGGGLGKLAFRRSMVSELPYFHVWFMLDGGYGHVVEDPRRWPKGDLFAREVIGGMLDVPAEVVKRQGRWKKGDPEMEGRVKEFKGKGWDKFDWTSVLMDAQ